MFLYGEKGKGFTRSICLRPFLFENVGGINNGGRVIRIIGKRYPAVKINSFLMLLNCRIEWASQYRLQKSCLISSYNSLLLARGLKWDLTNGNLACLPGKKQVYKPKVLQILASKKSNTGPAKIGFIIHIMFAN